MKRWWKRPRKLVLGNTVYLWSLLDRPQYRELRVFREGEKQPVFRLWLTYPECWAIDLFRPGAASCIIGWHEGRGRGRYGKPVILQEEPALLQRLLDLSFSPEEQAERARFLEQVRSLGAGPAGKTFKPGAPAVHVPPAEARQPGKMDWQTESKKAIKQEDRKKGERTAWTKHRKKP